MVTVSDQIVRAVHDAIYYAMVTRGTPPTAADLARECRVSPLMAKEALRVLADQRLIILKPGTSDLWAAPPFSVSATRFLVRSGQRTWFGACAWDAFGVAAAVHKDATIEAECGASGEPMSCGVRGGRAWGSGVVHLLVPAKKFWDDIVFT